MKTPEKWEAVQEEAESDLIVANFKVSSKSPQKGKNSDMGSDCAYFSDPADPEEDTLNYKLEDGFHTEKKAKKVDSDDEDYSDFKHQ